MEGKRSERSMGQWVRVWPENRKNFNGYYNDYIKQKAALLTAQNGCYCDTSPFDDVWMSESWKRCSDAGRLPVASVGAEEQIARYGHFIFSQAADMLLIGVPGKHNTAEWPDRGHSGFYMWQPIKGSEEYGYWCMVIDCKTGIITEIS